MFNKLHADLGNAMLSINAVKGFEYGMGFDGVQYRGSEMNDVFIKKDGKVSTMTNHSGGIQGGISMEKISISELHSNLLLLFCVISEHWIMPAMR